MAAAICAAGFPHEFLAGLPDWSVPVYCAAIVATTFAYAYGTASPAYFFAGLSILCLLTGRQLYELAGVLKRLFDWDGAAWFIWGIVWFVVGAMISAWKAGLAGRLSRFMPCRLRQAGRGAHVETQLHGAGDFVDVLTTGAGAADEAFLQLRIRNGDAMGDDQAHGRLMGRTTGAGRS